MKIIFVSNCSLDIEQYVEFKMSILISPSKSLISSHWVTNTFPPGYLQRIYGFQKEHPMNENKTDDDAHLLLYYCTCIACGRTTSYAIEHSFTTFTCGALRICFWVRFKDQRRLGAYFGWRTIPKTGIFYS